MGFRMREPSRNSTWRSREWWLSAHLHRPWRRSCSEGCLEGTTYKYEGRTFQRDHSEGCRRAPVYLGTIAKGWWLIWSLRDSLWRWSSGLVFAVGGEDNMVQVSVQVAILGRVAIGVKVPRAWTRRWVYQRREFGIELHGFIPTVLVAYDDDMNGMRSYYLREYKAQGKPLPDHVSGAKLWPGWRWSARSRGWRLKNRVFGSYVNSEVVLKVVDPVTVTLPEGDYVGKVTFYRETLKRPRWPRARRDDVYGKFETELWMPWPGKGENSYDCGDDGTRSHTTKLGWGRMPAHSLDGEDVARVVSDTVAYVLRFRARYGRHDWQPEGVGVLRG
jgi:hypothetical protein